MQTQHDKKQRANARSRVAVALRSGKLAKPAVCELCGYDSLRRDDPSYTPSYLHPRIVAHHWRGYDHPLDVWWICASCNTKLTGRHDGTLSKEQAREMVGQYSPRAFFEMFFGDTWCALHLEQNR